MSSPVGYVAANEALLYQKCLVTLFINNNRAIDMMKTYWGYKRAKYINVYYHFIKEKVEKDDFILVYILNEDNISNLLTKLLSRDATRKFAIDLGLYNFDKEKK